MTLFNSIPWIGTFVISVVFIRIQYRLARALRELKTLKENKQ